MWKLHVQENLKSLYMSHTLNPFMLLRITWKSKNFIKFLLRNVGNGSSSTVMVHGWLYSREIETDRERSLIMFNDATFKEKF